MILFNKSIKPANPLRRPLYYQGASADASNRAPLSFDVSCKMKKINIANWTFALIWFIFAIMFFVLAIKADKSTKTTLPRTSVRIPPSYNVQIGNVRFQDEINNLASDINTGISQLEDSIRHEARTMRLINFASCFLSVLLTA